jgi:hypothetical protein
MQGDDYGKQGENDHYQDAAAARSGRLTSSLLFFAETCFQYFSAFIFKRDLTKRLGSLLAVELAREFVLLFVL